MKLLCRIFQRLRNIVQTSYAPLYSAAVHNRFIHSLGVYHLGEIAYKAVKKSFPKCTEVKEIFLKMVELLIFT